MNDIIRRKKLSDVLPKNTAKKEEGSPSLQKELEYLGSKRSLPKVFLWILLSLFIIFLILAGSTFFTKVRLDVWPKTAVINVDHQFEATRSQQEAAQISFDLVETFIAHQLEITASGEENVDKKASGIITIYNKFDKQPQTLVANTRFETADNKIYRIQEQISVPGLTINDGKEVPGEIDVQIYAEESGENYNIKNGTFTIPGFKGSERYDKFYATTKTTIEGGFQGKRRMVSDQDRKLAHEKINEELDRESFTSKDLDIPANFLVLTKGVFVSYDYVDMEEISTEDKLIIEGRKKIIGIVFNKEDLAMLLAKNFIPNYQNEMIEIENWNELSLTLEEDSSFNPEKLDNFNFKIIGSPKIIWKIDEDKLKENLRGVAKSKYQEVLADFSSIDKAKPSFLPPWIGSIPENTKKIKINIIKE